MAYSNKSSFSISKNSKIKIEIFDGLAEYPTSVRLALTRPIYFLPEFLPTRKVPEEVSVRPELFPYRVWADTGRKRNSRPLTSIVLSSRKNPQQKLSLNNIFLTFGIFCKLFDCQKKIVELTIRWWMSVFTLHAICTAHIALFVYHFFESAWKHFQTLFTLSN